MAYWIAVLVIFALHCKVGCEDGSYDNHTLIRIYPHDKKQLEAIIHFKEPSGQVDVLKSSRGLNDSLDLLVSPNKLNLVQDFAKDNNLTFEVKQRHYGRSLDLPDREARRRVLHGFNVFGYNSYNAIREYIDSTARKHPDLVTLQDVGQSYQGRRMKLVKISSNPSAGNPIIFIDAGIHAREWVAPAMALYLIHRLTNDPEAWTLDLKGVDWYILPVVNPDGYEYTRSGRNNRLWRKTRSKNNNCFGVDGNRNYGYKWAVSGVSNNPCDQETYAGPKPFSEPETQMVRNIMMQNAKRLKLYISIHSYGQYLVYPWGYTGDFLPKEWKRLDSLARAVSDAVQRAGGQPFKVLSAGKWYPAAGGSDDYAFGAIGVPYSYTMELTDGYEFVFPEHLLRKVLPQFYEGFRVFGQQIRNEFVNLLTVTASECGCKSLRFCYQQMLDDLIHGDEESCVENTFTGTSTVVIFLKALGQYCKEIINVHYEYKTFESRHLYEVVIENKSPETQSQKPVIFIDAGMEGGDDSTNFGLYIIEQLIACKEYEEMIQKVKWVVLPCVNPDGLEHDSFYVGSWKKNSRPAEDMLGFGVDITRNFDTEWGSCPKIDSQFAPNFPGLLPSSENETVFVKNTLNKYKKDIKIYVSIKRDGHAILTPYAYTKNYASNHVQLEKIAAEVASKVNQKAGSVHLFVNNSIHEFEGKPHCGHNVDYAHELGIPLSFEMRVFLGYDNFIMSKFQSLPRGYENSLRNGYFSGIRKLYDVITNEKKYGRLY